MTVLTVSGTNPVSYTYTGPNQTSEAVKVHYSPFTVATNFGCASDPEYPPTQVNLVSSIELPDSTSYTFQYEATPNQAGHVTGRISQLGLPTGGSITYQYTGTNNGMECVGGTQAGLTRTLSDGSQWQYTRSADWTTTTVTDAAQNQAVITTGGGAAILSKVYQGSATGTPLTTLTTCYNIHPAPCTAPTGPPSGGVPAAITTLTLPAGGAASQVTTYLNSNTLPTEIDSYDFGQSSPTQKQLITYQSLSNGIADRQNCVQVLAGTNVPASCGTPTSNTKSLRTAIYDALGNLQSTSSWVSGVSSPRYLNRTFQHYSNGLLQTSTDVNNNQTTYGYQNCNNAPAYLSSVSSGGLTTSMTWDCNGGAVTQSQDANNQPTNFGYLTPGGTPDPLWRVLSVTDPLGNMTWNTYTATTKETALAFNNNLSGSDVLLTFDGLGRLATSQVRTAPGASTFDNTIQYGYGWTTTGTVTGPFVTQTVPGGTVVTTTQHDALGRVASVTDGGGGWLTFSYSKNDVLRNVGPAPSGENSKQKQIEYDPFGRIKSLCEISSALPGSGTCSQASSAPNGYYTTYTYDNPANSIVVSQNAQATPQTRSYQYDGIGRLTSETNPETGNATYVYDTDSTCGTYQGDLVKKVNAANITTCARYDALHRPTFASNADSNKCRFFSYDTNPGFGLTENNLKGRLSGAWVGNCTTGAVTTSNLGFNYSARGDVLDTYQWSAHSGGWYDVQATYWANGALNTLDYDNSSGGEILIPTITYSVDGEGRVATVSGSSLQNPVTSTSYNAASQVQNVTFGSGDRDSYQYDTGALRMRQYNYNVGSSTVTGNLTWNANGTLNQLAIIDPLNSTDAQTCNDSYDDLGRLSNVNCGTKWSQTFTYDAFGNITKSGSISWQPGYNATTNRYMLAGASYDANGNLTTDTFHTYTWDGNFGNPLTIDTTSLIYDALGRLAETANGTTYTEFVYGPTGKLATMHGQAVAKVFIALPAGDQAVYTGANNLQGYRHSDWLGSSRVESSKTQTKVFDGAYAPFGESYGDSGSNDHFFTGQIPGVVSDLYDFLYREYHPVQGRWISPDRGGLATADLTNPQSLNRYAYVENKPLFAVDPNGQCTLIIAGAGQTPESGGGKKIKEYAEEVGATAVFPYSDQSFGDSVSSGMTSEGAALTLEMYNATSQDSTRTNTPFNVITFSEGTAALNYAEQATGITPANTVLVEPWAGLFRSVPSYNQLFNGGGFVESLRNLATRGGDRHDRNYNAGAEGGGLCGHDAACAFGVKNTAQFMGMSGNDGCGQATVSLSGGSGGIDVWFITDPMGAWMDMVVNAAVGVIPAPWALPPPEIYRK